MFGNDIKNMSAIICNGSFDVQIFICYISVGSKIFFIYFNGTNLVQQTLFLKSKETPAFSPG